MLPGALSPFLLGRVIDNGILRGDLHATLGWAGLLTVVVLIGAAAGSSSTPSAVRGWLIALYGTQKLVTRKSVQLGHVLNRRLPTGEVLSISGPRTRTPSARSSRCSAAGSRRCSPSSWSAG